jgi:methyl halide transferase
MRKNKRFKDRYKSGDLPWDLGRPDPNMVKTITDKAIKPCYLLEIGCGTGTDSIWLAQQGFDVTATDLSDIALEKAAQKAKEANVTCSFLELDFQQKSTPGAPFEMIYDRGCFHSFDTHYMRKKFATHAAEHLTKGGLWLNLSGSMDDPPREMGPPRRSLKNIVDAVEPYFEILAIDVGIFDSERDVPPRAWICLLKKR